MQANCTTQPAWMPGMDSTTLAVVRVWQEAAKNWGTATGALRKYRRIRTGCEAQPAVPNSLFADCHFLGTFPGVVTPRAPSIARPVPVVASGAHVALEVGGDFLPALHRVSFGTAE